jgi:hypothetical protein
VILFHSRLRAQKQNNILARDGGEAVFLAPREFARRCIALFAFHLQHPHASQNSRAKSFSSWQLRTKRDINARHAMDKQPLYTGGSD